MTIKMVIPTMRADCIVHTLDDMRQQSIVPDKIVVWDNTEEGSGAIPFYPNVHVYRERKNVGTNKAWNLVLGEKQDYDYVGFCGDHRLGDHLIEKCIAVLQDERVGIVCPQMVDEFPPIDQNDTRWEAVRWGKGNCPFVLMRKEVAERIPKIPKELKIFFGDNWISHWIKDRQQLLWAKLHNGYIRRDSIGVSAQRHWRNICRAERHHYERIMREL